MSQTSDVAVRFWAKADKSEDCWYWTASRSRKGYGSFRFYGKTSQAHRVAWILTKGNIPDGLCVLHRCDTPSCVNPRHLFLGTFSDNTADMISKNRHGCGHGSILHTARVSRGEKHFRAKLTEADVRDICKKYASGNTTQRKLAAFYGIDHAGIHRIIHGEKWKHVVR